MMTDTMTDTLTLRTQYKAVQEFFATHRYDDWAHVRCHWCLNEGELTQTRIGRERSGDRIFCSEECQQMFEAWLGTYPKPKEASIDVMAAIDRRNRELAKANDGRRTRHQKGKGQEASQSHRVGSVTD